MYANIYCPNPLCESVTLAFHRVAPPVAALRAQRSLSDSSENRVPRNMENMRKLGSFQSSFASMTRRKNAPRCCRCKDTRVKVSEHIMYASDARIRSRQTFVSRYCCTKCSGSSSSIVDVYRSISSINRISEPLIPIYLS